jgi:cell division protein FtsB
LTLLMSPPDSAPLETLSLAELRDLVGTLVAKVADLGAANAALKAENQALRDEVARLKGPTRPRPTAW